MKYFFIFIASIIVGYFILLLEVYFSINHSLIKDFFILDYDAILISFIFGIVTILFSIIVIFDEFECFQNLLNKIHLLITQKLNLTINLILKPINNYQNKQLDNYIDSFNY